MPRLSAAHRPRPRSSARRPSCDRLTGEPRALVPAQRHAAQHAGHPRRRGTSRVRRVPGLRRRPARLHRPGHRRRSSARSRRSVRPGSIVSLHLGHPGHARGPAGRARPPARPGPRTRDRVPAPERLTMIATSCRGAARRCSRLAALAGLLPRVLGPGRGSRPRRRRRRRPPPAPEPQPARRPRRHRGRPHERLRAGRRRRCSTPSRDAPSRWSTCPTSAATGSTSSTPGPSGSSERFPVPAQPQHVVPVVGPEDPVGQRQQGQHADARSTRRPAGRAAGAGRRPLQPLLHPRRQARHRHGRGAASASTSATRTR